MSKSDDHAPRPVPPERHAHHERQAQHEHHSHAQHQWQAQHGGLGPRSAERQPHEAADVLAHSQSAMSSGAQRDPRYAPRFDRFASAYQASGEQAPAAGAVVQDAAADPRRVQAPQVTYAQQAQDVQQPQNVQHTRSVQQPHSAQVPQVGMAAAGASHPSGRVPAQAQSFAPQVPQAPEAPQAPQTETAPMRDAYPSHRDVRDTSQARQAQTQTQAGATVAASSPRTEPTTRPGAAPTAARASAPASTSASAYEAPNAAPGNPARPSGYYMPPSAGAERAADAARESERSRPTHGPDDTSPRTGNLGGERPTRAYAEPIYTGPDRRGASEANQDPLNDLSRFPSHNHGLAHSEGGRQTGDAGMSAQTGAAGPQSDTADDLLAAERTAEELRSYFEQARALEAGPPADLGNPSGASARSGMAAPSREGFAGRGSEEGRRSEERATVEARGPKTHDFQDYGAGLGEERDGFEPLSSLEATLPLTHDPQYVPLDPYATGPAPLAGTDAAGGTDEIAGADSRLSEQELGSHLEAPADEPAALAADDYHEGTGGRRGVLVIGALMAAVAAGGALGFAYKFLSADRSADGKPPLVVADRGPVKSAPGDPGGRAFEGGSKTIYDRLSGDGGGKADEARLVPRTESAQPRTKDESARLGTDDAALGLRGTGDDLTPQGALAAAEAALKSGGSSVGADDAMSSGSRAGRVASEPAATRKKGVGGVRRVKTVIVSADGIVPAGARSAVEGRRDSASAGGSDGVAIPGISLSGGGLTLPSGSSNTRNTRSSLGANVPPPARAASGERARSGAPASREAEAKARNARQPSQREVKLAARTPSAPVVRPPTSTRNAATATSASGGAGGLGGYVVQVSARRNLQDALKAFISLRKKYSTILGAKQPDIQEANLGARGKWYRLRIGPPVSKQAAIDLCRKLKSAGWKGCIVKAY